MLEDRWLRASADYFRWLDLVARARSGAAWLLGTTPDRVAFTGNTSCGLSLVAAGIDWRPGDVVISHMNRPGRGTSGGYAAALPTLLAFALVARVRTQATSLFASNVVWSATCARSVSRRTGRARRWPAW